MGRVERRMYRRRRKRTQVRLLVFLGLMITALMLLAGQRMKQGLKTELLAEPSPTPVTAAWDQTVVTREITLAGDTWYAIQTGVFSSQEAAIQKAGAYTDRGAPGVVVQQGDKWRVFIACYANEQDALAVRTRLGENQRVETYLYHWTCPEVRLRLTGKAGQIDVVDAGFTLMASTAATLRDAAILLDAGQLTTEEAVRQITAIDGQMTLWTDTARLRFGSNMPAVVESMLAMAQRWGSRSRMLQEAASSATTLSAELKAQAMGIFDEMIAWRASVAQ